MDGEEGPKTTVDTDDDCQQDKRDNKIVRKPRLAIHVHVSVQVRVHFSRSRSCTRSHFMFAFTKFTRKISPISPKINVSLAIIVDAAPRHQFKYDAHDMALPDRVDAYMRVRALIDDARDSAAHVHRSASTCTCMTRIHPNLECPQLGTDFSKKWDFMS